MQIIRCIASKPGLFDNKIIDVGERITVIYGRNNSGKSFLARAIVDLTTGRLLDRDRVKENGWKNFYLDILFSGPSGKFRYVCNGEKTLSIKRCYDDSEDEIALFDLSSGETKDLVSGLLEKKESESLGSFYEKVGSGTYMNTSFLPSPMDIVREGRLDHEVFKRIFVFDNSNFYLLYGELHRNYGNGNAGLVREEIGRKVEQCRELDKQAKIIDIQSSKYEKLAKEKETIRADLDKLKVESIELMRKRDLLALILEKLNAKKEIEKKLDVINGDLGDEKNKEEEFSGLKKRMEQMFPRFIHFSELQKQNLKKIQELYRELRDVKEESEKFMSVVKQRGRILKNSVLAVNIASLVAIVFIMLNVIITLPRAEKLHVVYGILGLVGLSLAGLLGYSLYTARSKVIAWHVNRQREMEGMIQKLLVENNIDDTEYKIETVYEFLLQYFSEYTDYTEMQLEVLKLGSQLRGDDAVAEMKSDLKSAKADIRRLDSEIEADIYSLNMQKELPLDADVINGYLADFNTEYEKRMKELGRQENILNQLEVETAGSGCDNSGLQNILDQKGRLEEELRELTLHANTMKYILDLMNDSVIRREKRQMERLIAGTAAVFHSLTSNQYITDIGEGYIRDLLEGNISGEENTTVVHLLLLSIKIAVTDFLIDLNIPLPLIIDEPFQFMDDRRIQKLKTLLDDVAASRQVIIFTHNNNFKDWGSFIEL
ncbi:MAG TPA: hypothetical protein PLI62_01410 [Spirochaetota bacterium]|nr:hypothetical protein [Spirochaetota bacterium]